MEEIEFSRWLFEGRLRQGKNVLPDGLNWQCYFAGSSKSHRENSITFIFLESPHQVDVKNVVKCWKDFLCYFITPETYRDILTLTMDFEHMHCRLQKDVLMKQIEAKLSQEMPRKTCFNPEQDNVFRAMQFAVVSTKIYFDKRCFCLFKGCLH